MMPAFSGPVFERCVLPVLHLLGYMTVGWGLEVMVVRLGEANFGRAMRAFVLDAVPAVHTRPVGGGSATRARGWDELFLTLQAYAHQMREHARFASAAEAARFAFPTLDDTANRAGLQSHLLRIRVARLLTNFWRAKVLAIDALNRLRKVDVRTRRR